MWNSWTLQIVANKKYRVEELQQIETIKRINGKEWPYSSELVKNQRSEICDVDWQRDVNVSLTMCNCFREDKEIKWAQSDLAFFKNLRKQKSTEDEQKEKMTALIIKNMDSNGKIPQHVLNYIVKDPTEEIKKT